ncbi:Hsp70 family protein [Pseudonocardia sp. T1-2H]|uniref:Hsp70 family protein n=1 Tax=Pseudonocardia sp. T1-2H TaxID=3128899 RepID=UPI0031017E45
MGYRLGIDLGATRTVAVVCRPAPDGPPDTHVYELSSVLSLNADGAMVPGFSADPAREARGFTARVGVPGPLLVAGRSWAAETLCAVLVRRLVDRIAEREGGQPEGIALSRPPSWSRHAESLLGAALEGFGLAVTFVAAPRAVAIRDGGWSAGPLAVLDLGESHCTAAVVGADLDVLAVERVDGGAGTELDRLLAERVATGGPADDAALLHACRGGKERLSAEPAVEIAVPTGHPSPLHASPPASWLDRDTFDDLARPLVAAAAALLRRTVEASGVDVADVLLVGGSARVPLVGTVVAETLGRPVRIDPEPEHAAAIGTVLAIQPGVPEPAGDAGDRGTAAYVLAAGATAANAGAVTAIATGPVPASVPGLPPTSFVPPVADTPAASVPAVDPASYSAPPVTRLPAAESAWEHDDGGGSRRRRTGVLIGASVLLVALGLTGIVAAWPREQALRPGAEAVLGTGTTSSPPTPSVAPLSTSPTVAEDGSAGIVAPQSTGAREAGEAGEARPWARTTTPSGSARNAQDSPPDSSAPESSAAAQPPAQDPATGNEAAQNPPAQNPPAQNPPAPNPPAQNPRAATPRAQGPAAQDPSAPGPPGGSPAAPQDRRQSAPPQGSAPAQPGPASSPPAGGSAPPRQQAPGSANRAPSGGASSTDGSRAGAAGQASAPPPSGAAPSAR